MGTYIIKDLRLLIRDRKELAILLLMPFILIAILGFALGGFINNNQANFHMAFALVIEDDEASGMERFANELRTSILPEEVISELLAATDSIKPQTMLFNVLGSEELSEMLDMTEMSLEDARRALDEEEIAAIVRIPANFTYDTLNKILLDAGDGSVIALESSDAYPLGAGVLHDIVNSFARSVSFHTALGQITQGSITAEHPVVKGGVEPVTQYEPVNSMQYYTFGMAVMFVLYVASSVASRAYLEKKYYVFDRLIMAGTHPLQFLGGKAVSAAVTAFIQLSILFLMSHLVFRSFAGKSPEFWLSLIVVSFVLSICVGAVSTLLTALNFRAHADNSSELYGSIVVILLSLLGGSFFPTSQMAEWIRVLGEWTPNGAALTSYLQATQGADMDRYADALIRLLVTAVLLFAISLWVFPKRRVG